jgi:lysophospholipase L1-like esterase
MNRRTFLANTALTTMSAALPFTLSAQHRPAQDSFLINAGIAGNNTLDLLNRLEKDCLAHTPELTILMAGTNDGMNHEKYVPLEEYRANLTQLVQRITDSGSKVILMTLLPCYTPYLLNRHPASFFGSEGPEGRRTSMNNAIREIATAQQATLLEMGHVFEKIGNVGTDITALIRNKANSGKEDGVHPTPTGYRFIALAVYDGIQYNKLPVNRIVCFGDSITQGDGSTDKESYPAYLKQLLQDTHYQT